MGTLQNSRRLYKSRTNRMIDGVCGGVAEYLNVDPSLVRIAWVLLTFLGGSGILLYIAGMIIIPREPFGFEAPAPPAPAPSTSNHRFWGILLVILGAIWLMSNLGFWHRWWGFSWDVLLPTLLILAGVAFMFGGRNYLSQQKAPAPDASKESETQSEPIPARPSRLYRSRLERKLFGVCGGLGSYFNIDPTIVRILLVISALASFGLTGFAYILMAIVIPEEPIVFPV